MTFAEEALTQGQLDECLYILLGCIECLLLFKAIHGSNGIQKVYGSMTVTSAEQTLYSGTYTVCLPTILGSISTEAKSLAAKIGVCLSA